MGAFYKVTKTIRGRRYDYWQRTWREGRHVRTQNIYIGPTGSDSNLSASNDKVWEIERREEALAEDQHYYDQYASPEEKKEMAATNPRLKLDPIIRIGDLSKKKQEAYMKESMRKIKTEHRANDRAERRKHCAKCGNRNDRAATHIKCSTCSVKTTNHDKIAHMKNKLPSHAQFCEEHCMYDHDHAENDYKDCEWHD